MNPDETSRDNQDNKNSYDHPAKSQYPQDPMNSNLAGAENINTAELSDFTENSSNITKDTDTDKLWDEIGFHKPMAGFWYNLLYTFIGIIISLFLMGYLINFFFPYPESFGYKDVTYGMLALVFVIFDAGTSSVMSRFIPEVNIKKPELMLHYIQYFIWYQMLTGLVQMTSISIYAIYFVPRTHLAYTVWLMLIVSSTQYPGFLGVFRNTLQALQYYGKTQTLNFLSTTLIQNFTQFLFVYIGRIYGANHPAVGEILGIAIGAAIGSYVDDFFATLLAAKFFTDVMKYYGIRPRDCFKIQFTWAEIKPVIIFSIKSSIPGILSTLLNLADLFIWITFVPQYTTFKTLAMIGGSIADVMDWFGAPDITPLVSESYMNKKSAPTQYYIGQVVRFNALLHGFFIPLILTIFFVVPIAWQAFHMFYYILATVFIIPRLIHLILQRYIQIPWQVITGANKINFSMAMGIISRVVGWLFIFILVVIMKIPQTHGLIATAIIMELGYVSVDLIFAIIGALYINRSIIKIKLPLKQIIFGILRPSLITLVLDLMIYKFVFQELYLRYGFFTALGPSLFGLIFVMFFVYFPLTGFLGAWDKTNLNEFRKVAQMSGPSKFIVKPIYKLLELSCRHSSLYDKFGMPTEQVIKDCQYLLDLKIKNRNQLKEKFN